MLLATVALNQIGVEVFEFSAEIFGMEVNRRILEVDPGQ